MLLVALILKPPQIGGATTFSNKDYTVSLVLPPFNQQHLSTTITLDNLIQVNVEGTSYCLDIEAPSYRSNLDTIAQKVGAIPDASILDIIFKIVKQQFNHQIVQQSAKLYGENKNINYMIQQVNEGNHYRVSRAENEGESITLRASPPIGFGSFTQIIITQSDTSLNVQFRNLNEVLYNELAEILSARVI